MDGCVQRWLQPDQVIPSEIVKHVTLNKFLRGLPRKERKAMGIKSAKTLRDMVMAHWASLSKPWFTACAMHDVLQASTPTITLQPNGTPVAVLLDS